MRRTCRRSWIARPRGNYRNDHLHRCSSAGERSTPPNQPFCLAFSTDTTLVWPIEQAVGGANIVAKIIELHPTTAGLSVSLSDAREVSTGYTVVFYNAEADTVTIKNQGGDTILTAASGTAWQIYLRDNSTANGLWRVFQQGAGTSTAVAAALAGAGMKAISTTLNTTLDPVAHVLDYSIIEADRATVQMWSGALGTFTLPNPVAVGADWYVGVKNAGTGSVTILPAAGTIDGSGSLVMATDESAWFYTDGSNFFSMGLGQAVNSVFDFISIDVSGAGDLVLAGAQLNRIAYEFTGILSGIGTSSFQRACSSIGLTTKRLARSCLPSRQRRAPECRSIRLSVASFIVMARMSSALKRSLSQHLYLWIRVAPVCSQSRRAISCTGLQPMRMPCFRRTRARLAILGTPEPTTTRHGRRSA